MSTGVLDVAIGIAFVYLLLSLLCTTLNEWYAAVTKQRAKTLEEGIGRMLESFFQSDDIKQRFWNNPIIRSQSREGEKPSYLSADVFARAFRDLISTEPMLRTAGPLAGSLISNDVDLKLQLTQVENWFNDSMDRVSGWYRRRTQLRVFLIAAAITLMANADTIHIAGRLWTNPTLRSALVEQAKARATQAPPLSVEYPDPESPYPTVPTVKSLSEVAGLTPDEQKSLSGLIGWQEDFEQFSTQGKWAWLWSMLWSHTFGWLATIIAISMGAPFWFDTMNKLINIRGSGATPPRKDAQQETANPKT